MEFNRKLQELRKRRGLTQEQLSAKLNISRTAVSKWESGRGFPNIEALKNISSVFNVPIDELLSGEELIDAAVSDRRESRLRTVSFVFGLLDFLVSAFIFLPFFGERIDDYIHAVSLLSWNGPPVFRTIYASVFIFFGAMGITEIVLQYFSSGRGRRIQNIISLSIHSLALMLFIAAREPYVAAFLFLLLLIKCLLLIRRN